MLLYQYSTWGILLTLLIFLLMVFVCLYRPDGHFVCESDVDYVRPGWAQNVQGEWVTILNTDKFPQTIRVEKCR